MTHCQVGGTGGVAILIATNVTTPHFGSDTANRDCVAACESGNCRVVHHKATNSAAVDAVSAALVAALAASQPTVATTEGARSLTKLPPTSRPHGSGSRVPCKALQRVADNNTAFFGARRLRFCMGLAS